MPDGERWLAGRPDREEWYERARAFVTAAAEGRVHIFQSLPICDICQRRVAGSMAYHLRQFHPRAVKAVAADG